MSRPATNGGSVRRRVVSLVVIALCSCGAGQSEREVRDRVETTIEQSCRANFPEPSARRDCIEMIRQQTNAGIAAAEAWLDGAPMTSESAEEATADSPVEWLLMALGAAHHRLRRHGAPGRLRRLLARWRA